ncbi:MAG TPA: sugar ABC transporter permease [Tepidisphaeraceae bacterium]|nr:sugar ABC transporter permease [Tepidisphaeraceae bacterium]
MTSVPTMSASTETTATSRASFEHGGGGWKLRTKAAPYLFLLPYFVVAAVFFVYPLAYAKKLAFYQTNGPRSRIYVGLDNFKYILTDSDFHLALWNTTFFTICSIFLQLPLSLGLAMLLNTRRGRLKAIFRLAIFAPNLVGQVFVGILFSMLFTPRYGVFNRLLQELIGWGIEQQWLTNPSLVMPAVVIAALWMYVGFNMIYFLAALQNVDQSLIEAARIDGAGPWQLFLNVTIPAIAPVATFVVVTSTIGSFQLFELPYALLQQFNSNRGFGPKNSGMTVVGYLFQQGFVSGDLGMAAAVGWLITIIILIVSLIQIRISSKVGSHK